MTNHSNEKSQQSEEIKHLSKNQDTLQTAYYFPDNEKGDKDSDEFVQEFHLASLPEGFASLLTQTDRTQNKQLSHQGLRVNAQTVFCKKSKK